MAKIFLALALLASLAAAAHSSMAAAASADHGKKLFNDPALGGSTNPSSCNTCHQDGKGLDKAGTREDLAVMINTCIVQALQGKKLDDHSPELESLVLYIRSLGR
jgi:cytochrome c peroxidase